MESKLLFDLVMKNTDRFMLGEHVLRICIHLNFSDQCSQKYCNQDHNGGNQPGMLQWKLGESDPDFHEQAPDFYLDSDVQ